MTMKKNDGGPAFPRPLSTDEHVNQCNVSMDQQGMFLRDWFAGQALAGYVASGDGDIAHGVLAASCYKIADAMLDERNETTEG